MLPVEITHLIYDQLRTRQQGTADPAPAEEVQSPLADTATAIEHPAGPNAVEDEDRQMSIVLQLREWFPELEEAEIQRYSNCHS